MLLIKAFTAPDAFGGIGLYAGDDIPKGTKIWTYNPTITLYMSIEEYFAVPPHERGAIERYSYPIAEIDESPQMLGILYEQDISRHSNHNTDPNTGILPQDDHMNVSLRPYYALRDIVYGEELTCNYLEFDPENLLHKRGVVTGKTFLIEEALPVMPYSKTA